MLPSVCPFVYPTCLFFCLPLHSICLSLYPVCRSRCPSLNSFCPSVHPTICCPSLDRICVSVYSYASLSVCVPYISVHLCAPPVHPCPSCLSFCPSMHSFCPSTCPSICACLFIPLLPLSMSVHAPVCLPHAFHLSILCSVLSVPHRVPLSACNLSLMFIYLFSFPHLSPSLTILQSP